MKVFDSEVFSGISVETTTENKDTLQAITNVNRVWHSKILKLNPSVSPPAEQWFGWVGVQHPSYDGLWSRLMPLGYLVKVQLLGLWILASNIPTLP